MHTKYNSHLPRSEVEGRCEEDQVDDEERHAHVELEAAERLPLLMQELGHQPLHQAQVLDVRLGAKIKGTQDIVFKGTAYTCS